MGWLDMFLCIAAVLSVSQPQQRPNVVFILADDLGVNDLGCYGRTQHRTPHLDRLAKEGVRFTAAYAACPVCSPTRAAIMTGMNPARLHLTTFLPGRSDAPSHKLLHPTIRQALPLEETTLAERLKAAGYATACIGKWHLGGARFGPKQQGFDVAHAGKANTKPDGSEGGKGENDLTRNAEEFIAAHRDRPFFLYLCHNTPHIPLGAKKELIERNESAFNPVYAAMMEAMDESVGRVLNKLDDLKLGDRTIVIFTSDNGGLHVPEGRDDPPTHNTPFRAGKGFLYEGGLRIPLIVRHPGSSMNGKTISTPVVSTDWSPTILDWCGLESKTAFDGLSLQSLFRGSELPPRSLVWHFPHYTNQGSRPGGAIRDGKWKLIEHYEDGRIELFDVEADVGETTNKAVELPKIVARLKKNLDDWKASANVQPNAPNPEFNAALHAKLYVDHDVSTLKPAATAAETAKPLREWRRLMDEVVRKK